MESDDNLRAPDKVVWIILLVSVGITASITTIFLSVPNLDLKSIVFFGISSIFLAIYMVCMDILIGSLTKTFARKCSAATRIQTKLLLDQLKDLKTSCQFGLFISFSFGSLLATMYLYYVITITFLPCFELYNNPYSLIMMGLKATAFGLNMYFYALSMDECYQTFRGILATQR